MSTFGTQSHVQTSARYPFLAETQQRDLFRIPSPISATTLYVSLLEDMSLLGDSTANSKKKICIYICIIKCIEHNCINIHTYIKDIIKMQIPKKKHIDIGFRFDTVVFKEKNLSFSLHISRSSPVPGPGESLGFWPHLWWIQGLGNHQFVELAWAYLKGWIHSAINKMIQLKLVIKVVDVASLYVMISWSSLTSRWKAL